MLLRKPLIALAATAVYAVVLVVTGSVELAPAPLAPASGQLVTMAIEPTIATSEDPSPAVPDPEQTSEEAAPTGTPAAEPSPSPPEPVEPAPAVDPGPVATPAPVPTAPAATSVAPKPTPAPTPTPVQAPAKGKPDAAQAPPRSPSSRATGRLHGNAEALTGTLEPAVKRHARVDSSDSARHSDGSPSPSNPTYALATPGPVPIGVPNFFIDKFRIPPFLLPIYQAAGIQYGIRWEVLAAINEIETDYGRNLNVSSAGALGWMQFMPQTWDTYGVDANGDGQKDPFNPVDAIFAAARYLRAAGADQDLRRAIFAYNHADWYVDSVLMRARVIGGLPADLVGSLTGLTQGRFPVAAKATYAGPRAGLGTRLGSIGERGTIAIFSRSGAPVIAVNDGRIVRAGHSARLGGFVRLLDVYGNTFTYGHLVEGLHGARMLVKQGARVGAGTIVGRVGRLGPERAAHVLFEIRPAGRGAPRIDPKPILDGWKLLESTAIYRSKQRNPFFGADAEQPSIGQLLLMTKPALQRHVLANPRIEIYACGRHDIASGQIDRRVLATLEFLAASGLRPTVSSLHCGHGYLTSSGNVSEHSSGTAVDIAAVNGVAIAGHQGPGSITDLTIQRLLTLQGTLKPHQIISLMTFQGADNTLAMGDHYDHIHIGFRPDDATSTQAAKQLAAVLRPQQWTRLIDRLSTIENPILHLAAPE